MNGSIIPPFLTDAQLVPVPRGEKNPKLKGWTDTRLPIAEAEQHVRRGGNLALRLGGASGHIVDSDLDSPESLQLADLYLPPTGAEFGRHSKARSHRLYRAPGALHASFAD